MESQMMMLEPEDDSFVDPKKKKSRIFGYTRFVVSASMDCTIRVWNVMTGIDECFTVWNACAHESMPVLQHAHFMYSALSAPVQRNY
jgi:hypothetical protein